jgi:hypothetical protein
MLKSRNADRDVASEVVPRTRVQWLADAAEKYKRLFAASTALAVVLGFAMLAFVLTDGPERVTLGVGKAGVADSVSSSETAERSAPNGDSPSARGVPDASGEVVDRELPEGAASYYGDELAGRPTASGESFDPQGLTAAHRTLPFGTRLRVTSVRNGRSVIVTVNDRGPFSGDRVLDLSQSAAREIGLVRRGEGRVRIEVLL